MGKRLGTVRALRAAAVAFGVALPTITAFWLPAHGDAASSSESTFIAGTNQERAQRGSSGLRVAGDLVAVARRHSQDMAAQSRLYHNPNVGNEVQGWQLLGENVGTGPDASRVEAAFMASPEHRANVLNPNFTEIGVSVIWTGNRLWVTELFRQPFSTAAAPSAVTPASPRTPSRQAGQRAPAAATRAGQPAPAPLPLISHDTLLLAMDPDTQSALPLDPASQARLPEAPTPVVATASGPARRTTLTTRRGPSVAVRHLTGVAMSLLLAVGAAVAWVATPAPEQAPRAAGAWRPRLA